MSEECNFRCSYCIHFNNLEISDRIKNPEKFMKFETAKQIINQYLNILREQGKNIAEINFGGGEPLLAWPVIQEVLEYCDIVYGSEFRFEFSINTNASLITLEIAQILKEYDVSVASSLDGLRDGNDCVRIDKTGNGTFSQIMLGFETLVRAGYPVDGIAVTLNEKNFHYLDESIIDWASNHFMNNVRIDIDVIGMVEIPIEIIAEKLLRIRSYANKQGIEVPGFWLRPAENLNDPTLEKHTSFCGASRGNSMCVNPAGDIFSCGYSANKLGSLLEIESYIIPNSPYYHFVKKRITGSIEMCKGCAIEGQCNGGCNITQEFAIATENDKIERMCDLYRLITGKILLEQSQLIMPI